MRNIALKLMYNGTAYHGWQVQKNAVSVCGTLEKALTEITGERVHLTGCGRTDAGVHAEAYVANFRTGVQDSPGTPALCHQYPYPGGYRRGGGDGGSGGFQRHRLLPEEGVYLPHL